MSRVSSLLRRAGTPCVLSTDRVDQPLADFVPAFEFRSEGSPSNETQNPDSEAVVEFHYVTGPSSARSAKTCPALQGIQDGLQSPSRIQSHPVDSSTRFAPTLFATGPGRSNRCRAIPHSEFRTPHSIARF